MSNIPEEWARRMVARNFVDRRGTTGAPSLSALADACGVSTTTITSAITGARRTSPETAARLAAALGEDVLGWLGLPRMREWEPPEEAMLLTDRQRKAVEEIIRAMTERREDVGNDDRSASTSNTGQQPATVTDLADRQASADHAPLEEILGQAANTDETKRGI